MKSVGDPMEYTLHRPGRGGRSGASSRSKARRRSDAMAARSASRYRGGVHRGLSPRRACRRGRDAEVRVVASRTLATPHARRAHAIACAMRPTTSLPRSRRNDVAAVVIATPDDTHEALAIEAHAGRTRRAAAEADGTDRPQPAAAFSPLRSETGADLQVSWMHRYFEEVEAARSLLARGAIGRCTSVRLRNATPGPDWGDWFFRKDVVSARRRSPTRRSRHRPDRHICSVRSARYPPAQRRCFAERRLRDGRDRGGREP